MKKFFWPLLIILLISAGILINNYSNSPKANVPEVLLRFDDIGMNHSVNMAIKEVAETGIPFCASIMFPCPWYQEAVEILKNAPNATVGIHLTLNSEWKNYRWGPITGKAVTPGLVDEHGHFHPSVDQFLASQYTLEEVEAELEAQIQRALATGLKIVYVDYHMWTAIATPELRAIVEKLAGKYNLAISRFFGEYYRTLFDAPVKEKGKVLTEYLNTLKPETTNLIVLHVAKAHPEMHALVDMNNASMNSDKGADPVSNHRQAELDAITSKEFLQLVKDKKIRLVTYADLVNKHGLKAMKKPDSIP